MPRHPHRRRALLASCFAALLLVPATGSAVASPAAAPASAPTQTTDAADTTGPALAGHTVTPTSIDLADGPAEVTVRVHLTDATGVASAEFSADDPSGQRIVVDSIELVEGTVQDGTWEATLTIPQDVPSGRWVVVLRSMTDTLGNSTAAFRAIEELDVTGGTQTDVSAPVVEEVTADPSSWNLDEGPAQITVTARLTDETGADAPLLLASHRSGQILETDEMELVEGTAQDGLWQTEVTIPTSAPAGAWIFTVQRGVDVLGNPSGPGAHSSATTDIAGGTGTDVTAPVVEQVTASPSTWDLRDGPAEVTVRARVTDETGVERSEVFAHHDSGQTLITDGMELVEGTPQDGIWQTVVTVPTTSVNGPWHFEVLGLADVLGNQQDPGEPAVATVEVTGGTGTDLVAPAVEELTVEPAVVDLADGRQTVTARTHVTDETGTFPPILEVTHPSGETLDYRYAGEFVLVEGTEQDGIWETTATFPGHVPDGPWELSASVGPDVIGNSEGEAMSASVIVEVSDGN